MASLNVTTPLLSPLELHEIFVGCCDMTESIKKLHLSQNISLSYSDDIETVKQCTLEKNMQKCRTLPKCRTSSKGNYCLPDFTKIESTNNQFQLTKELQNLSFTFNSKYDGKLLKLVKLIPFKINETKYPTGKPNLDIIYETTTNRFFIGIYLYNNIKCICFPSGLLLNPEEFIYKNKNNEIMTFSELIPELFDDEISNYLICGHSMGGAYSQYLCSLDWGNYERYKTSSYLISSAPFKCLTEEQVETIKKSFNNRYWIYGFAIKFGNLNSDTIYFLDSFLNETAKDMIGKLSLPFTCIHQYININQITILDISVEIDTQTLDSSTQNFQIGDKTYTFNVPSYLIQIVHSWTDSYRKVIRDLIEGGIFNTTGGKKTKRYKKSIKKYKKNKKKSIKHKNYKK